MTTPQKVLVTGANGFVGQAVCRRLIKDGWDVRAVVRREVVLPAGVTPVLIRDLSATTDWSEALAEVSAVVHLAARVHVMKDKATDPLAEFRAVNTAATLHLARQAAEAGVRHFVYMSSVKVNGEENSHPYTGNDTPNPQDPYGQSKAEAEDGLARLAASTLLKVTVLRPPLVYGPRVGGNFRSLLGLVDKALPLPLGAIANRRSMIYVENLADAVAASLTMTPGMCEVFTLSDGEDVSAPQLVARLAEKLDRPARLLAVPVGLLRLLGKVTGKSAAIRRLTESLQVDNRAFCLRTGWRPPFTLDQGLAATAEWFKQERKSARAKR